MNIDDWCSSKTLLFTVAEGSHDAGVCERWGVTVVTGEACRRSWLKGATVLVVLLGLTWAFGFLYVNSRTVVMAYVFTVLNSLQGLFIFIFHCIMTDKVRLACLVDTFREVR